MKTLVLYNGGLKSTFLATLARREGEAVLVHCLLSTKDLARLDKTTKLAAVLGFSLVTINLVEAPPLEETLLHMLYLTLQVLPIAKEEQCKCIYHGLSRDDDPRILPVIDAFTKQLGDLVLLAQPLYDGRGFWLGNIEMETPLRRLDRPRVIRLGNEWSIPWELTWSCMRNGTVHCGECPSCLRRKDAFKREGHDDPTTYQGVAEIKQEERQ